MNRIKQAKALYSTMVEWLGDGAKPVHPDQAQKRADICLKCPNNNQSLSVESIFKDAVASTIRKQIELKNQMKLRVNGEKSLGICDVCHCVLRLKVHVPFQFVDDSTDDETVMLFPQECWYIQELKGNL